MYHSAQIPKTWSSNLSIQIISSRSTMLAMFPLILGHNEDALLPESSASDLKLFEQCSFENIKRFSRELRCHYLEGITYPATFVVDRFIYTYKLT